MLGVAGAGLAALPTVQVPEVGATAVTALALHVGQAVALPTAPITVALLGPAGAGVSAQRIAGATWNRTGAQWEQGWGQGSGD